MEKLSSAPADRLELGFAPKSLLPEVSAVFTTTGGPVGHRPQPTVELRENTGSQSEGGKCVNQADRQTDRL